MKKFRVLALVVSVLLLTFLLAGCTPKLISLSSTRGASGEGFIIYGENFGQHQHSKIPSILRRGDYHLEVLSWSSDEIRVRIPSHAPSGNYKVLIYDDDSFREHSNALDFWVTAAPVPAAITDPYEAQVRSFRIRYAKSFQWEGWMLDNRSRYQAAFLKTLWAPYIFNISFRYHTRPIAYNPPWDSEAQHMAALVTLAEATYPGYLFSFTFNGDTASSDVNVIAGYPGNSYALGKDVYLHYETIFGHEFAHVLGLLHHYDTEEAYGTGQHMPPGESTCYFDRDSPQFCSACRTALNIPLDVNNGAAHNAAVEEIMRRYPPEIRTRILLENTWHPR